ncbi:MAG: zinc-binding alcohol dehydrogenase [Acidobacteria bacterium]|nr:zinc-binding alcohol dehydrogenase [Acidobacteriota bacterium]
MGETARAFWTVAPGRGELRDEVVPAPGPGDVLVETLYSGISRGTESTVFHGRVPPEEYQRMRAPFQTGDFPGPLKFGYSSVGRVLHGPDTLAGRIVFALYPHQSSYVVPASAVHVVPEAVPAARAVLAANMETALNGVWDAAIAPGDRVTVVGAGTVGCLVAWLASRVPGCEVELVDVADARQATAQALGVAFSPVDRAARDRDVVVHASGSSEGLDAALTVAGFEAMVVELSWYGDRAVHASLGKSFHAQRLTLKSSQVGHLPAHRRARWTNARRLAVALSLLTDAALDALITGESAFDDLPSTMVSVAGDEGGTLCHRVRYPAADPAAA